MTFSQLPQHCSPLRARKIRQSLPQQRRPGPAPLRNRLVRGLDEQTIEHPQERPAPIHHRPNTHGIQDPDDRLGLGLGDHDVVELEIAGEAEFRNLLLGLRSYHYRAQRRAVTTLREFYYDTRDWKLLRRGYSCRLVERLNDDGTVIYFIEITGDAPGERAFAVASEVSGAVGQSMTAGSWEWTLSERRELAAVTVPVQAYGA